jgi:hypothetical protein
MKTVFLSCLFFLLLSCGCNNHTAAPAETGKEVLVLRFELDSAGAITDAAVKQQLRDIAVRISKNADRIMLHSYTEKMDTPAQEEEVATQMARAAKEAMAEAPVPRVFYNVGIDIHGSSNLIDSVHPSDKVNRRIEVEFL